ncbi:type II secretion system F family protein [Saccharophagus degradans]|uniref:Type II secretion system F family protein n=1 Tax=Saccharophagus degradans TaxID=86304 RepID=A0AAW7X6Z1_9GAMM|nr:type II secretion system F family protein [Saccharophagus degradans]MDO6423219.1 type II secretion system F family protein [Saccharophagus degradans]MDO6607257.1 type II secretion system F family protein [Saccharophagus degradans]
MAKASTSEVFVYKGVDKKGHKVEGTITSVSSAMAKAQLIKQGVRAKNIRKKPKPLFGDGGKPIKPMDIALFTRQLATMMKAGVPLVQSFEIVADGSDNKTLGNLIRQIKEEVSSGNGFAPTLRKHPKYFDELFCNLVESGEQSGALETMLDRIATYKEKTEQLKAKIKKALTYPIAVVVVAIVVTLILLIKVVPQFAETFTSFGGELPMFTQFVLGLSDLAKEYWFIVVGSMIGGVIVFSKAKASSKSFAAAIDRLMLRLPIIGNIVQQSILARFGRTLSTTFAAGVPLIDALQSVAGATGNSVYTDAVNKVREEVSTGTQLNRALSNTQLFPPLLIQMTAIGEESGALDTMLDKVASYYEEAVDNLVDNLTSLLEPMIMAVLGILIGGMMIAMYLPIFKMGEVV